MSQSYKRLLEGNRTFARSCLEEDPKFFERLAHGQAPEFLWIGCADSRVPADRISGTLPGQIFVTRNIANLVIHSDMSMLSVLEYAVRHLRVKHIIVCGHYGCGGVKAAMSNDTFGLLDNWLRHIKDLYRLHHDDLAGLTDPEQRERRLVELNVVEQVYNVCNSSVVQKAWKSGTLPHVHGWVFDVATGLLENLAVDYQRDTDLSRIYDLEG